MTFEEMKALSKEDQKILMSRLKSLRHKGKTTVYSATYGVGAAKLARELKTNTSEAKALLEAYWKRNWAIRQVAEDCVVKTVNGQKWLFNPVSKFWYSLRSEKDRFSTLNQGTGVYCFDVWIKYVLRRRRQLTGTFHDEGIWEIELGNREKMKKLLYEAMEDTNNQLNLNVTLGCDIQFGASYADIH
jgi:DNA polymerase I-like protein with 3'-5' exonuclease and polymerase domains